MYYYFRRIEDDEKHMERMKMLFEKFKELNLISKEFTIQEIDEILKTKYHAKEIINDGTYMGLNGDPEVCVEDIVKMYKITDPNVLVSLHTDEEIESIRELIIYKVNNLQKFPNSISDEELDKMREVIESEVNALTIMELDSFGVFKIQNNVIKIALESKDNQSLTGCTLQALCKGRCGIICYRNSNFRRRCRFRI